MKFTGTIDAEQKVTIPEEVLEKMHLNPGASVEIEICEAVEQKLHHFDAARFDAAMEKYSGILDKGLASRGYATVDEYMADIRPE